MTTHLCVWFEDGSARGHEELVCVCGERAVVMVDDDGARLVVVVDASPVSVRRHAELAISA